MEQRITYLCDGGAGLTVIYSGDTARILTISGDAIVLQRRQGGSGVWYESPTHSLRGEGREISYTVGRMTPMTCREIGERRLRSDWKRR